MKITLAILACLTTLISVAHAANYISQEELTTLIKQQKEVVIVDIQPAAEFEQHRLQGSVETNAFPAKTAAEKQKLDTALPVISATAAPVVIVCPRGGSGAKNSYDYLLGKGIPEERLLILKGGIAGWSGQDLILHGR